MFDKLP